MRYDQIGENVSDDEPPNYLSVLEEHHSHQRMEFEERNKKAFANPIPSAIRPTPQYISKTDRVAPLGKSITGVVNLEDSHSSIQNKTKKLVPA